MEVLALDQTGADSQLAFKCIQRRISDALFRQLMDLEAAVGNRQCLHKGDFNANQVDQLKAHEPNPCHFMWPVRAWRAYNCPKIEIYAAL